MKGSILQAQYQVNKLYFSMLQADVQNLKDAVGSAVDVMQAMASSICSLSSKVAHSCNYSYI